MPQGFQPGPLFPLWAVGSYASFVSQTSQVRQWSNFDSSGSGFDKSTSSYDGSGGSDGGSKKLAPGVPYGSPVPSLYSIDNCVCANSFISENQEKSSKNSENQPKSSKKTKYTKKEAGQGWRLEATGQGGSGQRLEAAGQGGDPHEVLEGEWDSICVVLGGLTRDAGATSFISVTLGSEGRVRAALLDSGAIGCSVVAEAGLSAEELKTVQVGGHGRMGVSEAFKTAGDDTLHVVGVWDSMVNIQGARIPVRFLVVRNLIWEVILGDPFLRAVGGGVLSYGRGGGGFGVVWRGGGGEGAFVA